MMIVLGCWEVAGDRLHADWLVCVVVKTRFDWLTFDWIWTAAAGTSVFW